MNRKYKLIILPFLFIFSISIFFSAPEKPLAAVKSNSTSILLTAKHLIGTPYLYGGSSPKGFDCSGFVNYVYKQNGITLSRSSSTLWTSGGIRTFNPMPGDILFFNTNGITVSHVAIYMGNGEFIHSATGGVQINRLAEKYYQHTYVGSKRFL